MKNHSAAAPPIQIAAESAAWQVLLDCGIDRLPVDLNIICRELRVRHASYERYWVELPPFAGQMEGIAFYEDDVPTILYDNRKPPDRIRFVVAHELGHLVLNHVKNDLPGSEGRRLWTRDESAILELDADLFAVQLLAPFCVLRKLGLHTPETIAQACRVPVETAWRCVSQIRARKGAVASPMERALCERFQEAKE